jgi:uncharacterized protein (DUF2336 family)
VIVRRFLAWARIAPACARADATSALARAFLFTPMSAEQRYEAEVALTVMLDDPSPLVRRAMAEAIASAAEAPRHLITGLVALGGEAAAIILERTQLLSCAELVDAAALGSERAQIAIARREALPTSVAAALAEVGSLGACLAIIRNRSALATEAQWLRMLERFGADAPLREALLRRDDLPAPVRERLMAIVSGLLKSFVVERAWLSPERAEALIRDAGQHGALALACDGRLDLGEIVACLKKSGRMTPAFLVHALLAGRSDLVIACLADLCETPPAKVAGFLGDKRRAPLLALLKRAGIPHWLAPVFPIAIAELKAARTLAMGATAATPLRVALRRILARLEAEAGEETRRLTVYLRALEEKAAREEARTLAEAMITLDEEGAAAEERRAPGFAKRALRRVAAPAAITSAQALPAQIGSARIGSAQIGSTKAGLVQQASTDLELEAVAVARAA